MMNDNKQSETRGTGTLFGLPYDWRRPAWSLVKQRSWNPHDPRLLTPKSFGWGYDINLFDLLARIGLLRRR